jgi:endonuclease YncB( thermonuclease family)
MGIVLPFRRWRWATEQKRSTPRVWRASRPRVAFLRRYFGFLALAALIIGANTLAPSHDTSAPPPLAGAQIRVIDGDSLRTGTENIRLIGIDAPELLQTCRDAQAREWPCGQAAKTRLIELVSRGEVACTARGHDRYGRTLALCSARGIVDLGEALVRDGYAVDYRRYTSDYLAAEREARAARRGLWQGEVENPEDWRRHHPRSG